METMLRMKNGKVLVVKTTLKDQIESACSRVNVTKEDKVRFTKFVRQSWQTRARHQVLVIIGEAGSGKTYMAKKLMKLCDPTTTIMIDERHVFPTFVGNVRNLLIVSADVQDVELKAQ